MHDELEGRTKRRRWPVLRGRMLITQNLRENDQVKFPSQYGPVTPLEWMKHECVRLRERKACPRIRHFEGFIAIETSRRI